MRVSRIEFGLVRVGLVLPLLLALVSCASPENRREQGRAAFTEEERARHAEAWRLYLAGDPSWPSRRQAWLAEGPRSAGVLVQSVMIDLVTSFDRSDIDSHERARVELLALSPTSIPYLVEGLVPAEDVVRKLFGDVLVLVGEPAVNPLLELLDRKDPGARRVVVSILGQIGDKRSEDALARLAVLDPEWAVRAEASEALAACSPDRALIVLSRVVREDSDGFVRRRAALALSRTDRREAIPPLVEALRVAVQRLSKATVDEDAVLAQKEIRDLCSGLGRLTGQGFGVDARRWLAWWEGRR